MKTIIYILSLITCAAACSTPSDRIIQCAKEKYGENIDGKTIDISDVFDFNWDLIYIFPPLTYPEDIQSAIGFEYKGDVVRDDNYLFLFVSKSTIAKKYIYSNIQIGFSDDLHMGVYMITRGKSKYKIKCLGPNNYWLYLLEE